MKPPNSNRTVSSTLQGEHIDLSVDTSAMAHIMSIMTNLYNDAEMAVLREYSTNAYDANREVGNDLPIDIKLPSVLSPTLVISDRGPGLSLEDIREIYSKYGASTKRGSNDANGMFGLGCKSALTYSDQFTVTSVKNGVKVVVSVSRDAEGGGGMTVVFNGPSDAFNGTEVTIPTQRHNNFAKKAEELYQWWPEGSVLVNGKAPERWLASVGVGTDIGGGIYLEENANLYYSNLKPSVIVMGNVAYPIKLEDIGLDFGKDSHRVVAFVDMGAVEPLPSREALRMSTDVKRVLLGIGEKIRTDASTKVIADIDAAPTRWDAYKIVMKSKTSVPRIFWPSPWAYHGEAFPDLELEVEEIQIGNRTGWDSTKKRKGFCVVNNIRYNAQKDCSRMSKVGPEQYVNAHFFYGFDVDFTANHRKRLELWYDQNNITADTYSILVKDKLVSEWIDPSRIHDWEEVRKIKLPTTSYTDSGRLAGSYDVYLPGKTSKYDVQEQLAADIDTSQPIYYYVANERTNKYDRTRADCAQKWAGMITELAPGTLLLIPPTREAKLLRQFPAARNVKDVVKDAFDAWFAKLSHSDKLAMAAHGNGAQDLKNLDGYKIEDPDLVGAINLIKTDITTHRRKAKTFEMVGFETKLPDWSSPLLNYPLVNDYYLSRGQHLDHTIIYINAAYRSKTGKVN